MFMLFFSLVQIPKNQIGQFKLIHIILYTTKFRTSNLWVPVVKRAKEKVRHKTSPLGVADGARTRDTQDHNLVLYQLNYSHHHCLQAVRIMLTQKPTIVKTAGSMGCVQEKRARHAAPIRVTSGNRTRDIQDHNLVLYLLSYNHHFRHVGRTL